MVYVLALLWISVLTGVGLALWLIHDLTTPANPDVVDLQRHRDARQALGRINSRHSIATTPTTRRDYGTGSAGCSPHGGVVAPLELAPVWGEKADLHTLPSTGAKAGRSTPAADGAASHEAAGTTGRAAHALRAHAGPAARHRI